MIRSSHRHDVPSCLHARSTESSSWRQQAGRRNPIGSESSLSRRDMRVSACLTPWRAQFGGPGLQRRADDPRRRGDRHSRLRAALKISPGHRLHHRRHHRRPVRRLARCADRYPWLDAVTITDPARDRAVRRVRHHPAAVLDRAGAQLPAPVAMRTGGVRGRRGRAGRRRAADRRRPDGDRATACPRRSCSGWRWRCRRPPWCCRSPAPTARSAAPLSRCCCSRTWRWSRCCSCSPASAAAGDLATWSTVAAGGRAGHRRDAGRGPVPAPALFAQAARTKSPELFLAVSLLTVILASLATSAVGLSPILGALIAGVLIAETDYRNEVEVVTAPLRGLALGVFLITVGMRIDLPALAEQLAASSWSRWPWCWSSRRW